jgi:hypothetical protein
MECSIIGAIQEVDNAQLMRKLDILRDSAKTRLDLVNSICTQFAKSSRTRRHLISFKRSHERGEMHQDRIEIFIDKAAEVQRMLCESLASSERLIVPTHTFTYMHVHKLLHARCLATE